MAHYGPNEVLSVLTEFILRMRERYLIPSSNNVGKKGPRVLIVAHDWGALLAFRLAAEAPQLADRFILSNAVHPPLALANVYGRLETAKRMLRSWTHNPRNLRLLTHALSNVKPLLIQVSKSGYVFTFRLPAPLASKVGEIGDFWFMRVLNAVALGDRGPTTPANITQGFDLLGSSVGPGVTECDTVLVSDPQTDGGLSNGDVTWKYSESVRRRSTTAGWMDKIALYRDGCFSEKWEKPLDVIVDLSRASDRRRSSGSSGFSRLGSDGAIEAPVTLIWGQNDPAIESCLALDGLQDSVWRGSQLVKVKHCGHWTPIERNAIPIFEAVLKWALEGETTALRAALCDNYPMATIAFEK